MAANRPKKSKSPRIIEINDYLDDIENRLKKHYRLLCEKTDYVTAQRVKDAYHGFGDDNKTLLEAYDYRLQQVQQDIGIGHKQSTYDKLSNERRCLESFLKDKYREDMLLKEPGQRIYRDLLPMDVGSQELSCDYRVRADSITQMRIIHRRCEALGFASPFSGVSLPSRSGRADTSYGR